MKNIPIVLIAILVAGCVSPQQMLLNDACETSKKTIALPQKGTVAEVHVSFKIKLAQSSISINETAICDYQGSICPAGDWYEVWYGNQETKREIILPQERSLTIWHHGLCISLDSFKKTCAQGNCNPIDHFEFKLELNSEETKTRTEECSEQSSDGVTNDLERSLRCGIPNVEMVTIKELQNYGYEVSGESIEVINAKIKKSN